MAKYRNNANREVIIQGVGRMVRIPAGAEVELEYGIARRGFPYLVKVEEAAEPDTRQVLIESPLPVHEAEEDKTLEEEVSEEAEEVVEEESVEVPVELLDGSVSSLREAVADIDEVAVLEGLLSAEEDGKTRKSAVEAIKERIEELS